MNSCEQIGQSEKSQKRKRSIYQHRVLKIKCKGTNIVIPGKIHR